MLSFGGALVPSSLRLREVVVRFLAAFKENPFDFIYLLNLAFP